MTVWNVASVNEEPELVLEGWRVYELKGVYGDALSRHFVGTCSDGSGRVSSGIQVFDATRRRGTTRSGRVYELTGRQGLGMNAEYVWNSFCRIHPVRDLRDVTDELVEQINRALGHFIQK